MRLIEDGPKDAAIWLCGEAPGETEIEHGRPFRGASGMELDRMLHEAGIERSKCFATNVCHERPPSYFKNGKLVNNDIDQWFLSATAAKSRNISAVNGRYPAPPITEGLQALKERLAERRPVLVIALGNTPLWALCGHTGITKWRGSELSTEHGIKVIPTFHPADVLRQWTHRPIVVQDFRRARREAQSRDVFKPNWNFTVAPTLNDIRDWFATYCSDPSTPIISDTEGWGRVDCIGFATDSRTALCVPFARQTDPEHPHYWQTEQDELEAALLCRDILRCHPTTFHNAIWDCQVIAHSLGFLPRLRDDTQVAQHVAFPGLLGGKIDPVTGRVDKKGSSLSLSFVASMYCDHYRYWKDDGRTFDPTIHDERQYWRYNCEDVVRTAECRTVLLDEVLAKARLTEQYRFEMSLFGPVLRMMFRGINYDIAEARRQREWMKTHAAECRKWLNEVTGTDFNPDSTPQMRALFYDDLRLPKKLNRKTHAPTLDDAALDAFKRANPLLWPLISNIQNYRTLDTLRAALEMKTSDSDGRLRTAMNIAFVETMRFSSNETALGEGSNIQNIKRPDND